MLSGLAEFEPSAGSYGIVGGLQSTYNEIGPAVAAVDPALHAELQAGFTGPVKFVSNLYQQELNGTRFTPEQADLFGTEAQTKSTALTGQISLAIALLGLQV